MNRRDRRAAKAGAEKAAGLLARLVYDISPGLPAQRVTDPRAIKVLERGFLHVLRNARAPHLMRVTPEVAATFPRYGDQEKAAQGWDFYLALGVGCLGRGTFLLRPILVEGVTDPTTVRRMVEARMFDEFRLHLRDTAPIGS